MSQSALDAAREARGIIEHAMAQRRGLTPVEQRDVDVLLEGADMLTEVDHRSKSAVPNVPSLPYSVDQYGRMLGSPGNVFPAAAIRRAAIPAAALLPPTASRASRIRPDAGSSGAPGRSRSPTARRR